jgi:hypothetical protein
MVMTFAGCNEKSLQFPSSILTQRSGPVFA